MSPSRTAFVAATATLIVVMMGANMPLPLFPTYVDDYGLSAFQVTSIFATYTLFIAPALLFFGPLSDTVGRRPVLAAALVTAASAALVLGFAQNVWWLYAGRALQGISVGAIQGSAAAAMVDTHPRGDVAKAAVAGTFAISVAGAVGPMSAGIMGEYLPAPLLLSFIAEIALVAMALVALFVYFPSIDRPVARSIRIGWPTLASVGRAAFLRASYSAVLAWGVAALFLSLAPTILRTNLSTKNMVVSGGIVALMLVSSALVQIGTHGRSHAGLQITGHVFLIASLAIFVTAVATGSVFACSASTAVAGAGLGLAFSGSTRAVGELAPRAQRGNVMSLFFVAIYLGATVSVVGLGLLATVLELVHALQIFSAIATLGCLLSIFGLVRASMTTMSAR